ncbi:MAG TPA: HDOD domain-containing protein [Geomonas sp.]|nr:HDOD domain-containing protein [Geomonas sp.]
MQIPEAIRDSVEALRLPSMPQVLLRFLDLVEDGQASLDDLAALVGQDPSLSARFLAVANSPFLRRNQPSTSLAGCLNTLGPRLARTIVQCLVIDRGLSGTDAENVYRLGGIWGHSLRVAEMARAMAVLTRYHDCEVAYLAGLLHDIGQLLLLGSGAEHYGEWLQNVPLEAKLRDVEELLYHTDHAAIGAWLVDQWQPSSFLSDAILFHHQDRGDIVDADLLSKIVWSCHAIDTLDLESSLSSGDIPPELATVSSMLELDLAALCALQRQAREKVAALAGLLGITEGADQDGDSQRSRQYQPAFPDDELEARVRDLAVMQLLQRDLSQLCREEEILVAVHECARILFGAGKLAFLYTDAERPLLSAPALAGQPLLLQQLEIRLDSGRSLAAAVAQGREPRSSFDKEPPVPPSLVDLQVARALGSEGVLYVPMSTAGRQVGVMAYGLSPAQHARLRGKLPRMARFAQQAAASIEGWRAMRGNEERMAATLNSRFQQHARKVVHEAGNPLGIIKNYLTIVAQKLPPELAAGQELEILGEEVDRVALILQRLGDLSEPPPATDSVDLNGMISGLLALYGESLFAARGIVVEKELSPSLLPVAGNRDSIKQILLNLWSNAAEALSSGDRLSIGTADNVILNGRFYVEIRLSDSGPGLPPDVMQCLFQPLDARRRPGHSGIGLSIVASLIEGLDGLITCRSSVGSGTSFVILLPQEMKLGAGPRCA